MLVKCCTQLSPESDLLYPFGQSTTEPSLAYTDRPANESVVIYTGRATDLRDRLLGAGCIMEEAEVIMCILKGLPPHFNTITTVLRSTIGSLDINSVRHQLIQAEQLTERTEKSSATALYTGTSSYIPECWYCGKRGHTKAKCHKRLQDQQNQKSGSSSIASMTVAAM